MKFTPKSTGAPFIRPPFAVPGALPAIAGTDVPDGAGGRIAVRVLGFEVPVRIVARSRLFPTVVHDPHRFVVIDEQALFAYLNGSSPGIVEPTEAWFAAPPPRSIRARLARPPFRDASLVERARLERTAREDSLALHAQGFLLALAAIAAGLAVGGLLMASAAIARDERAELAEYEAMGVERAALARALRTRLAVIAALGLAAALAGGAAGTALTASLVAVTGAGGVPLPPIEPVLALPAGLGLLVVVVLLVGALARRTATSLGEPVAQRLRGG